MKHFIKPPLGPYAYITHTHTHSLLRTFYFSAVTLRPLSIVLFPGSISLPVLFPEIAFQAWNPQPFTSLEKHLCYLVPKLLKNNHIMFFCFCCFLIPLVSLFQLVWVWRRQSRQRRHWLTITTHTEHASVHCYLEKLIYSLESLLFLYLTLLHKVVYTRPLSKKTPKS